MKIRYSLALLGVAAVILLGIDLVPRVTAAYTVYSRLTPGCHERITTDVLREVRLDLPTAPPLPLTSDEQALVDDLEFSPADDMKDLGGATLLIGVRDNDLKGRASDDLTQLAMVHGDPNNQDEHCLRNKTQDEPDGSAAAVNDCRTFIRNRVSEALDGLDTTGLPDIANRTSLPLHLSLRGDVDALLPTFYVRMGQAIHAVEDSFSHTYRTADQMQITVVLNWIDEIDGTLVESRDGPAHMSKLDVCSDPDELRTEKRRMATRASVALLRATLEPQKTKEEKMAAVDGILDTYLTYKPGCTFDNNWCDAPERQYKDQNATVLGCASLGGGGGAAGGIGALLALALAFLRRRKANLAVVRLLIVGTIALTGASIRAAEATTPDKHEPPPPVVTPVAQPGPADPSEGAWGAYLGVSGSASNPAVGGQLGIRRRVSTHWTFGWDAELNPWLSLSGPSTLRAGSFNTYSTVILRFPLAYEDFNLRTTFNLGLSYLLVDLYGAPKGSLGLYAGLSPLGLEWKLSRMFLLIINPLSIAVPVPQLRGVPLMYPQYRFSIGLGILAG